MTKLDLKFLKLKLTTFLNLNIFVGFSSFTEGKRDLHFNLFISGIFVEKKQNIFVTINH